jgi:hypothetical protein
MSHTRATLIASGILLAAIVALSVNSARTEGSPTRSDKDRAAIGAAADRVTHTQIADAWTQMKLFDARPMDEILRTFPLPHRTTYENGDGIVLVFDGHGDTCIDFLSRPNESTVSARRC